MSAGPGRSGVQTFTGTPVITAGGQGDDGHAAQIGPRSVAKVATRIKLQALHEKKHLVIGHALPFECALHPAGQRTPLHAQLSGQSGMRAASPFFDAAPDFRDDGVPRLCLFAHRGSNALN